MDDKHHQEIIVIKRHSHHEEEHHGGAWKIAFADFMTAMMAFFLVLWIINATDKNTKTIIARYFNPLKLEDMSKANKGIRQITGDEAKEPTKTDVDGTPPKSADKKPDKKEPAPKAPSEPEKKEPGPKDVTPREPADPAHPKAHLSESALLGDPYASLDQIAGKVLQAKAGASTGGDAGAEPPAVDPDAFVDPFKPVERASADEAVAAAKPEASLPAQPAPTPPAAAAAAPAQPPAEAPPRPEAQPPAPAAAQAQPHPASNPRETSAAPPSAGQADADHPAAATGPEAAKLQKELAKELRAELHAQAGPGVEVQATSEGILISLTDEFNFEMFAVGSAEPQAKVVHIMEKVAQILKTRPGSIVLRGHTDGRPFKSGAYDNWRLSEARAQMAYYMLIRGGLEEKRVERIEGYADHHLKTPDKPEAAENRRIEILLRKDKS
jgi:chemotaxis protein MotB